MTSHEQEEVEKQNGIDAVSLKIRLIEFYSGNSLLDAERVASWELKSNSPEAKSAEEARYIHR